MVENGCEHEGLRLDMDLMALEPGLKATLDAMVCDAEGESLGKTLNTK